MTSIMFGSGTMWWYQTTGPDGSLLNTPIAQTFGLLQDVTIDCSFDAKMMYGGLQNAIDIGRGKGKLTGKAKFAQLNANIFSALFFGQSAIDGLLNDYNDLSVGTAIPSSPYQITVSPPSSGMYMKDLGVRYVASGVALMRTGGTPGPSQYSVDEGTGTYTFNTGAVGLKINIDYQYSLPGGKTIPLTNQLMGYTPQFGVDLTLSYLGKITTLCFMNCQSSKLSLASKLDDYTLIDFEFDILPTSTGVLYSISSTDIGAPGEPSFDHVKLLLHMDA